MVRSMASIACVVSASCGRCTGTISAYLGSAKYAVEELEPGRRLDVSKLQVGHVDQTEQRAPGPAAEPGTGHGEVLADQVRLARR